MSNTKCKQGDLNRKKYLKAPPIESINAIIKDLGISVAQYERFIGIKAKTILQVRVGERNLPAKFWHYIYEKIIPTYGMGIIKKEKNNNIYKKKTYNLKKKSSILKKLKDITE
jgi:hypothetical protein